MSEMPVVVLYASMAIAWCSLFFGLRISAAALLLSATTTEAMNAAGVGYTPARWFAIDCLVIAAIVGPCLYASGASSCWRNLGMRQRFILCLFGFIWAGYQFPYVASYDIGTYAMAAQLLLTLPWATIGERAQSAVRSAKPDDTETFRMVVYA